MALKRFWPTLVALTLFAAACGSETTDISADAGAGNQLVVDESGSEPRQLATTSSAEGLDSLLGASFSPTSSVASARFEGEITLADGGASGLPGEITLGMSGAYDLSNDSSHVTVDLGSIFEAMAESDESGLGLSGLFEGDLEVITIGERSWLRAGFLAIFTGSGDKWLEGDPADSASMTGDLGAAGSVLPADVLDSLGDAPVDIEVVGQEQIRGVNTTHHRVEVDLAALVAAGAEAETALADELGIAAEGLAVIEVWLDDDGLLHRYVLDLSGTISSGGDEALAGATVVFDMWDHGQDVGIQPPPADEVIDADELDLFGGLGTDEA